MIVIDLPDETATAALAARIAALAGPGDVIALKGDLGAGKTSFARAFIRARGNARTRCRARPSRWCRSMMRARAAIWHFDCYRLRAPEEAWELGIEDAFSDGISLIEWPERLGPLLPERRLEISLRVRRCDPARERIAGSGHDGRHGWRRLQPMSDLSEPAVRPVNADGSSERSRRKRGDGRFLDGCGWAGIAPVPLAGDASFRRYYRLARRRPPRRADGCAAAAGGCRPYIAVAKMLRELGLSAPEIYAEDRARGFLLIEDFGDDTYTRLLARGADETALYTLAIDTLVALHRAVAARGDARPCRPTTRRGCSPRRRCWSTGMRRRSRSAASAKRRATNISRSGGRSCRRRRFPATTLVLRDYHVDNLMLLPDRSGVRGCGLLDFQDAVCGPGELRSRFAARGRPPRCAGRAAPAMTERYLAAFPGARPRGLPALGRDPGGAAQLQDPRHLHPAVAARRQARAISSHIPRVWRLLEDDLRASRPWRRSPMARPPPAARVRRPP